MTDVNIAIANATKWLRENPDKHIGGVLAEDLNGRSVDPSSPEAICFCALGRIAKELNISYGRYNSETVYSELRRLGLKTGEIIVLNDGFKDIDTTLPGNPAVLDYLDNLKV